MARSVIDASILCSITPVLEGMPSNEESNGDVLLVSWVFCCIEILSTHAHSTDTAFSLFPLLVPARFFSYVSICAHGFAFLGRLN
jgi:hypothetical protein